MNKTKPVSSDLIRESGKNGYNISNECEKEKARPVILLHSCCGPCSTAVVERLITDYDIALYFFNPNITEEEEYNKRLKAQEKFVEKYNSGEKPKGQLSLIKAPYNSDCFFERISGLENAPEGGERCIRCFEMRLEQTAEYAALHEYDSFSTTLSVSPHKDFNAILKIGSSLALRYGLNFISENFKKMAGFQRSIELSKIYELYRQSYCGCVFSKNERNER